MATKFHMEIYVCEECGNPDISMDATTYWNAEDQTFEINDPYQARSTGCWACGSESVAIISPMDIQCNRLPMMGHIDEADFFINDYYKWVAVW